MLKRIFIFITLLGALSASAQSIMVGGKLLRGEFNANAGLNTDGYQIGLGIGYFPSDCFGLRFTIDTNAEIEAFDDCDCWSNPDDYTIRLRLTPALVFRTPRIIPFREPDSGMSMFAEPGITFSPGASGSNDARTVCWDLKAGFNFQFGIGFFTLGYECTNFSLYSGRPYSHYEQPVDTDRLTHSVYAGFGIKF